jgi:hypothetical protein
MRNVNILLVLKRAKGHKLKRDVVSMVGGKRFYSCTLFSFLLCLLFKLLVNSLLFGMSRFRSTVDYITGQTNETSDLAPQT